MCVHVGNLDSYFEGNKTMKQPFLEGLYDLINDGITRYFVPDVNSGGQDVASIVRDLISVGFSFQESRTNLPPLVGVIHTVDSFLKSATGYFGKECLISIRNQWFEQMVQ